MLAFLLISWLSLCVCVEAEQNTAKRYDGYSVMHVQANDEKQLAYLHHLHQRRGSQLDFWKEPRAIGHTVAISADSEAYKTLDVDLRSWGMEPEQVIEDLQTLIDEEKKEMKRSPAGFSLYKYNRISEMNEFLDAKVEQYPNLCSTFSIGKSTEGRDLKVLKISAPGNNPYRQHIWVDAGIHAREWIAPATAHWIIEQLLTTYQERDYGTRALLETYDFHFLPSVNPDGYEYSHEKERMWRKTRSNPQSDCPGVDPNRNWDFHWMETGASDDPCSEIYAGPVPFSEPETRAVADFFLLYKERFLIFITLHSYGQFLLTPWGYTSSLPDDYADLEKAGNAAAASIYKVHGQRFAVGTSTNVLYSAAGGSDDWAKGVAGIKYSYTPELRPDKGQHEGGYGFLLPESLIPDAAEEFWLGFKFLALEARRIEGLGRN